MNIDIKTLWCKWGMLYAIIATVVSAYGLMKAKDVQTVTQTVVDQTWKKTVNAQTQQIASLQKLIQSQTQKLTDMQQDKTVTEHFDAVTGKLIERLTQQTTEIKQDTTRDTTTKIDAGSTITNHVVSTDSGSSLSTKTVTVTPISHPWLFGLGWPLDSSISALPCAGLVGHNILLKNLYISASGDVKKKAGYAWLMLQP